MKKQILTILSEEFCIKIKGTGEEVAGGRSSSLTIKVR